jgi:hypothetical protein
MRKSSAVDYENSDNLLNLQEKKNNNRYKLKCCCLVVTHTLFGLGGFGLAVLLYQKGDLDCPYEDGSL